MHRCLRSPNASRIVGGVVVPETDPCRHAPAAEVSNPTLKVSLTDPLDTGSTPRDMVRGTGACGHARSDRASRARDGNPPGYFFGTGNAGGDGLPYLHARNAMLASMEYSASKSGGLAPPGLAYLGEAARTGR